MKAIMEYELNGALNGKVTFYPKNYTKEAIITELSSYNYNDANVMWKEYDYFIKCALNNYGLNINAELSNIYLKKDFYQKLLKTKEDKTKLKLLINEINMLYLDLIKKIENLTNKIYGLDYILN